MEKKILCVSLFLLFGFYLFNFFSQNKNQILVSAQAVTITPACTTKTQGDANCDSLVNDNDYTLWKNIFLGGTLSGISADFNLDTKTDLVDFEIWRRRRFAESSLPTSTISPQTTPTTTACLVCNLRNSNPCGSCGGWGRTCTSRRQVCGNNPECWTNGRCVERDPDRGI